MPDNTDDPISGEYRRAGQAEFDRVHKDPHTVRPGRYVNQGQVDPTHPGPKTGRKRSKR